MANNQIDVLTEEMLNWEKIAAEAKEEAEKIREQLKEEMYERDVEELSTGKYILRWTTTIRNVFDSAAFKKVHADLYKAFQRSSEARRWSVTQ